jgi:hypothetical protein
MLFVRGEGDTRFLWYLAHADLSKVSFNDDEIGLNKQISTHLKEEKGGRKYEKDHLSDCRCHVGCFGGIRC